MPKTLFIVNPASRGGKNSGLIRDLSQWVKRNLPGSEIRRTQAPGHAIQLVKDAASEGLEQIFAVGGDGTLHEVVNGLALLPKQRRPAVGVISSGTGGDFARTLREKYRFPKNLDWLKAPAMVDIDMGRVDLTDAQGLNLEKFFINIAGVGISGEVVKRVNASGKHLGSLEYLRATLAAGLQYRPPSVELVGGPWGKGKQLKLLLAVVANGRYFGGGMCIAPEAAPDDQRLELLVVEEMSYLSLLREIPKIYLKKKIRHPQVQYAQSEALSIRVIEGILPVDLDGEFLYARRVDFEVVPKALSFLVP